MDIKVGYCTFKISMKFETQSGMKIALYLPMRQKNIWDSLSLCDIIFGAVTRIRPDTMYDLIRRLIGLAKMQVQRYMEEAFSHLSSTVEEIL